MTDYLEFTIDKFTFRIAPDRFYNDEGVWAKPKNTKIRIGISDYLQQRSGDVAFAEVKSEGTVVEFSEELAVIETIKVNISLSSPVAGKVIEVNPALDISPDVINHDPYGDGWLAVIEVTGAETSLKHLLKPQAYLAKIKLEAEREVKKE